MAELVYKRLVDVKILNEYYLLNSDEGSFFAIDDAALRKAFLDDRVLHGQYNLTTDLTIEPIGETKKLLKSYRIRLVPQSTGFMLGMEVDPVTQEDGSSDYFPKISFEKPVRLHFGLQIRNPLVLNFSSLPYRSSYPAIYFCTNDDPDNVRNFPVLSLPIADFQSGKIYEMGELAVINNAIHEAIIRTNSADPGFWRQVEGNGFLNEQDRNLLPASFVYTFNPESEVNEATFTLKTIDGAVLKTIQKTAGGTNKLSRVNLNFSFQDIENSGDELIPILPGSYELDIAGNNGFSESHRIHLNKELYQRGFLGVVEILIDPSDTGPFGLLRDNGALITAIDIDGAKIPHPELEIRIKGRITYWRYISNKKKELAVGTKATSFLTKEGRVLVSNEPRNLSFLPTLFTIQDQNQGETLFLPNPEPTPLKEREGRIYSDIYVSQIKDTIEEII